MGRGKGRGDRGERRRERRGDTQEEGNRKERRKELTGEHFVSWAISFTVAKMICKKRLATRAEKPYGQSIHNHARFHFSPQPLV